MRRLAKLIFLVGFCAWFLSGCTVYTEKQSESLSQAAYATKDSIDCGRFDLADSYSAEVTRLVRPPKNRISILPVYKNHKTAGPSTNNSKPTVSKNDNEVKPPPSRTVVIPPRFGNDPVVVVGTEEYNQLLQDNKIAVQLRADFDNLQNLKVNLDKELQNQYAMRDKMVEDLIRMQKQLVEKDLALLRRNIIIVSLISLMSVGVYLRIKGIL